MRSDCPEVLCARRAEAVDDAWRPGLQRGERRILRIEEPQRVRLESPAFEIGQLRRVRAEVRRQLRHVRRPALGVADRVEQQQDVIEAGLAVETRAELDELRVDRRTRVADGLHVPLPELAVATGLGAVVAEHRPDQGDLHRLRPGVHPVLDVAADDARGRLGPEGPDLTLLATWDEAEELLLDDVRHLADAPLEHRRLLEQRRLHLAVAVAP